MKSTAKLKQKLRKTASSRRPKSGNKTFKKNRPVRSTSKVTPPKDWRRRWLWYLHPKRFQDWWFTRPGMKAAAKIAGVWAGIVFIGIAALFLYFAKDLPSPGQINARALEQTTRFYDRTGEHILYEVFGDQNRTYINMEDMGEYAIHSTIAIEDRNFYRQGAFSFSGILRATYYNVTNKDMLQGGSTITQQYVKNALLSPERTLTRKIKELILSIQIEQFYSKDDILELYLNEIPYGAQAYGVQAASQMFFSKDAVDLTLAEAAMLAALPQAPTYYSPYGQHTEELVARQQTVLYLMADQGYISEEEAEEAMEVDILAKVNDTPAAYRNITAPHFVLAVQDELEEKYGTQLVTEGGLKIITTLDMDMQKAAEKAVKDGIAYVETAGGNNAALVAADSDTAQIMAMVGSRDFNYPGFGAFNAATARRQPGSSFKPYVYAAAMKDSGWGAGSILYDVGTDFNGYRPNNFDNRFRGAMTMRKALAESRNIPAVKMLYIAGIESTLETARSLGINTLEDSTYYGLSLGLGAAEVRLADHVNGYTAFANGGIHRDAVMILKVTEPNDNVLEEYERDRGEQVIDPQIAYILSDILSDDPARAVTFGANSPNFTVPGHTVAIKTGTTDDLKDGWMMGYTRSLTAGVWVGHNQNATMHIPTSSTSGPIFTQFMAAALEGKSNQPFERPAGIKTVTLDALTGDLPAEGSRSTVTDIFPAWYEPRSGAAAQKATIDKLSGLLATRCTPPRAREEVTAVGVRAEIPPEDFMFNFWNPPVQALAKSLGVSGGATIPDKESTTHKCSDKKPQIKNFDADQDGDEIEITLEVEKGRFDIQSIEVSYNNQVIKKFSSAGKHEFSYKPSGSGNFTFQVLVIDKGLYDAEGTTSAQFSATSSNGGGVFPIANSLALFRRYR